MDPQKPKRKRRRRDFIAPSLALVAIAIVAVTEWRRSHQPPPASPPPALTEQGMHDQLARVLPAGSSFTQAQSTLQTRGFHCELIPPNGFMTVQPLFCTRDDAVPEGEPLRWQVIITQDQKGGVGRITVVRNVLKQQ